MTSPDASASLHYLRRPDATDLVVAFSARAVPRGKFTFWKVLHQLNVNVLFVNDHSAGWYLKGTPEMGSAAALGLELQRVAAETRRGGGKVHTLGTSMGAYAALVYGAQLGVDRVLALGPESELCMPHGRSISSLRGHAEGDGDISQLEYRDPRDVVVLSGNGDVVDFYSACKLKSANPDLDVRLIENHTHVVARHLESTFGMGNVIDHWLLKGRRDLFDQCATGPLVDLPLALAVKTFHERLVAGNVAPEDRPALAAVARACPSWALAHYFHGCALEADRAVPEAIEALARSIALNPALGRARFRLASLFKAAGRIDEAICEFEQLSAQAHTLSVGDALSRLYLDKGLPGASLATLERSTRLQLKPEQRNSLWQQIKEQAAVLIRLSEQGSASPGYVSA